MLHLTRNATSDVEFGTYSNAGLTNLTLVLGETSVNGCTRCANFAAKEVSEFVEKDSARMLSGVASMPVSEENTSSSPSAFSP